MGRLSKQEITNILLSKGYEAVDLSSYQNKTSKILCKCPKGHIISASLHDIEKPAFRCPSCEGNSLAAARLNEEIPEKNGYRIVALDQSSKITALSVFDNGKLVYYDCYQITGDLEDRLVKYFNLLNTVVFDKINPDYLIYEDIQYEKEQGVVAFKVLGMIYGVTTLAAKLHNVEFSSVMPKVWKADAYLSGSNRAAQKASSIERVKEMFGISVTDDISDSILIGKYACHQLYDKWNTEVSF